MKSLWVTLALSVSGLVGLASAQDSIRTVAGETLSGRVTASDYASVKIEDAKKKATELTWDQVDSITFKDAKDLDEATRAIATGDVAAALAVLTPAIDDKKIRPVVRQEIGYLTASCLYRSGKDVDGDTVVERVRTEFPTGRRVVDVLRLAVDSAIKRNDAKAAQSLVDKWNREGKAAGLPPAFENEMRIMTGRVHEGAGRFDAAAKEYGAVATASGLSPNLVAEAQLGAARSDKAAGRSDPAEQGFRKVVKMPASTVVLAAAWNGIGDIQREKGKASRNADALLEAVYDYLRGCVLYLPKPGDATIELERALAGAAQSFQFLAEIEADKEVQNLYRLRSNERWNELRRSFPQSKFLDNAPK